MKYIKILFLAILAAVSCQKLDRPELDGANELSGLKCYVYYDAENVRTYSEVNPFADGTTSNIGAVTAIAYTFPSDAKYTAQTLKNCRLEATIPSTATLVELDATGKEIGKGIGGMRNLAGTTVYFKVVAADGGEKRYQVKFNYSK